MLPATGCGERVFEAYLRDPRHGPLPALLLVLTVLTGLVDAVSILALGRVFVANMTGNVVFIGFALARAPGFSLAASLSALAGFLLGALLGGSLVRRRPHRGRLLRDGVLFELVVLAAALVLVVGTRTPLTSVATDLTAALAATALGSQNAVVRALAVPDLTTTVLTMTLTGIAADIRGGRAKRPTLVRRLLAVGAMFGGAVAGALLVLHHGPAPALGLAVGLLGLTAVGAVIAARGDAAWHT